MHLLSGTPYGYRYLKKTDRAEADFEIVEAEAEIVRFVNLYRANTEHQIPTRRLNTRCERSTIWAMLCNPAYEVVPALIKRKLGRGRESYAIDYHLDSS
jgi:site-specific DNA recombinase